MKDLPIDISEKELEDFASNSINKISDVICDFIETKDWESPEVFVALLHIVGSSLKHNGHHEELVEHIGWLIRESSYALIRNKRKKLSELN